MLLKLGNFDDHKESFLTSELIEGKEAEFMALAPTHLVIQNKSSRPVRHTIDYTSLNGLFKYLKTCLLMSYLRNILYKYVLP